MPALMVSLSPHGAEHKTVEAELGQRDLLSVMVNILLGSC